MFSSNFSVGVLCSIPLLAFILGAWRKNRLNAWQAAYAVFALLSTLVAFSDESLWRYLIKPLVMPIAIAAVLTHARQSGRGILRQDTLLIGALAFSTLGDCFLMFPGFFVQGLGSFLVAHLFFLTLFKTDAPWFLNRLALLIMLGIGVCAYALFINFSLALNLRVPVALYITTIALMCAQAIGRSNTLNQSSANWVAIGASMFVLSDLLIGIDKFVAPIPLRHLWVSATYYAAQYLIVWGILHRYNKR